jgi:hypothetical protein
MLIAPFALAAALPLSFEDLADMDARIAAMGSAAPVDRRLKLPRCPLPADIAPTRCVRQKLRAGGSIS